MVVNGFYLADFTDLDNYIYIYIYKILEWRFRRESTIRSGYNMQEYCKSDNY